MARPSRSTTVLTAPSACGLGRERVEVAEHELLARVRDVEPGVPGVARLLEQPARGVGRDAELGDVERAVGVAQPERRRLALVQRGAERCADAGADESDLEPIMYELVTLPGLTTYNRQMAVEVERTRDRERTRAEILDVATREFAEHGFSGARVDEIAERTRTTKRMLYYYFESKEGLYTAVLERAYARIRDAERDVDVQHLDPIAAIRRLAELTFDHHEAHPEFIRLVSIENIHRAEHMRASGRFADLNTPALDLIGEILARGRAEGVFRRAAAPADVHMLISSFCVFRVANRHTWATLFDHDLLDPAERERYKRMLGDMVVSYLTAS